MWRIIIPFCSLFLISACAHPAQDALQGHWNGQSVENFRAEELAAATGWARGTSLSFHGSRVTIRVPDAEAKSGTFRLASIEQRRVTLDIVDTQATRSELVLIVDDEQHLRWDLGEGRSLVLEQQ